MAQLKLSKIAEVLGAEVLPGFSNNTINRLLLDSRQYSSSEGVLFFALRGKNHDGHSYIQSLLQKGVRNFVVEEIPRDMPEGNFLKVRNTLVSLQRLAAYNRQSYNAPVVGITGSNGKTVVKEWLAIVLETSYRACRSPKSYNSQIGVPLSVWELGPDDEIAIFEAGISQPGEMDHLENILKPEMGIFTNIGSAHEANFESRKQKIREKLKLYTNSQRLVYEAGNTELSTEIKNFAAQHDVQLLSWSLKGVPADLMMEAIPREGNTLLKGSFNSEKVEIELPFSDEASLQNAMHTLRLALELNISRSLIKEAFASLSPVEMRLQMKAGTHGNIIINDAYNSDLESLRIALHYLQHHSGSREKVLIISDMHQSGLEAKELSLKMSEIINRFELSHIIGIGGKLALHGLNTATPVDVYATTDDFLKNRFRYHFKERAILLKGARQYQFEKISNQLEEQSHETVLNIYMSRMVHNLNYFRNQLKPGTRVMAMVKAFSYGSGTYEIANLLQFHKVDYLGVAYTDEAVALRKAGIALPILVLNAEASSFHDLLHYNLEPEVYSFNQLEALKKFVEQEGVDGPFPIHIKIETGMHRLGFEKRDIELLTKKLNEDGVLKVVSALSHLAASDDSVQREFTLGQINKFKTITRALEQGLGYSFIKHISNSSGISNYSQAHFDMVRLGIGLYGVGSNNEDRKHLKVVSELLATVSQVKNIEPGDSVGYGRSFMAEKQMQVAVISIGYADGFRRSLSNGVGEVVIEGQRYPVVGRVCMDMAMVDVTGSEVQEGDRVEVFGPSISVYELANKMDTIPYEVLTGISPRVKRVYFME